MTVYSILVRIWISYLDKAAFYTDQKGPRIGRISEDVDLKYVKEKEDKLAELEAAYQRNLMEEMHMQIDEPLDDPTPSAVTDNQLNLSITRSGAGRSTASTGNFSMQIDSPGNCPSIRMVRNCTNKIKATCAEVSVRCNVSNEVSRICVQTVASCLYDHQFYLTKEEAIEKDPLLKEYRGTIQRKPPKMARTSRLSLPEATKLLPHSTDDWKPYEYVLPSARTQTDFK